MPKSDKTLTIPSGILSSMSKSCLWIRTASGPDIGFGHLKRTMVLARSLKDCCLPLFVLDPSDRWSRDLLADHGLTFFYEPIESIWTSLPEPKAILIDVLQTEGLASFINEAKNKCLPVASIHEMGRSPLPSDIVIDGCIAADAAHFPERNLTFYTGTDYMILDPVYRLLHQQEKRINDRIHNIFINLGGDRTDIVLKKILGGLRLWNREIEVFAVPGYSSWAQEGLSRKNWRPLRFNWVQEHVDTCCFQADLAITTGGVAAYETLCAGTPLLAISYDHCENNAIRAIADAGACIDLGVCENFNSSNIPEILTCIESEPVKRNRLSLTGRNIVDGSGVERVARIIRELISANPGVSLLEGVG